MSRIIREAQPSEAVISAGMEPNGGFVIEDGGKIVGYFGFMPSPELTYAKIYEGEWINYILRLYQREGQISVDTSINGGGGGFGALVGLIATAINTAATDKVVAGRKCNAFVLSDLPAGKYSKMYETDMKSPAGKPLVKATVK